MTSVEWSFVILGVGAALAAFYGMKRYGTALNPLTILATTQIGLFTILSGIVAIVTPIAEYTSADVIKTIMISLIYMGAVTLPYFLHGSLLSNLFGKALVLLQLNFASKEMRFSIVKFTLLIAGTMVSFFALAYLGGGGTLWLTNTREAYITYRAGAGPFFALTQWLLTFAFLYYIWTTRPRTLRLLLTLLFFCTATSLLGSKNNVLIIIVIGIVYYNFYIRRMHVLSLLLIMPLMIFAILAMLVSQDTYSSLLESLVYFRDYFDTTAQLISRFDEFGFHYGQGWLSSLWFYVPRGFYPDKPYEYGETLIHQVLFPEAAALGTTPGFLSWSLAYLDFGALGVFLFGLLNGMWSKAAYEYFLKNRSKFFAFIFAMQFSIWPIWSFAPLVFVIVWCIAQSIFLRLELGYGDHPTSRWGIRRQKVI